MRRAMLTTIGVPLVVVATSAEAIRSDLSMAVSRTAADLIERWRGHGERGQILRFVMTTADGLIWMRAVMGIAGAFIFPISLAVLPTIFSEQERPRAIAIGGAGMFLGLPLGPSCRSCRDRTPRLRASACSR